MSWRALAKIVLLISVLLAANLLAHGIADTLNFQIRPGNEDAVHRAIMASAFLYSVLLAIPFVPGVEIGLALIAIFGPPIVLLVYVCTVAGLSLSFIAGRMIPLSVLIHFADDINFHRTKNLLKEIEPLGKQERLTFLANTAPNRLLPLLLRFRHLALVIGLNIPGNFLVGGGGGIALLAGISRLYSLPGFLVTIAIAVAPVPIAVLAFGTSFLSG